MTQMTLEVTDDLAQLRTVLSDDDFRAWLHLPNELLDARSTWVVIRSGNVEAVAELAEDMLSGNPAQTSWSTSAVSGSSGGRSTTIRCGP